MPIIILAWHALFDHKRMKEASIAILRGIGNAQNLGIGDPEQIVNFKLSMVAQAFVDLQQARRNADYDIEAESNPLDAAVDVAQARAAFQNWAEIRNEPLAQEYLYSLLFRDR